MDPAATLTSQEDVEALMSEVRVALERFGISLGKVHLRVVIDESNVLHEGSTIKVLRPPPTLRGIEAVTLRPGLTCLAAAQVLAHEYTHCWLWLQNYPVLPPRLEEGLCELLSYLYLLSLLREGQGQGGDTGYAVLERDADAIRAQILSIEANAHPDYGGGFRECVAALRGRTLHELLYYVQEHGCLPPRLHVGQQGDEDEHASDPGGGDAASV